MITDDRLAGAPISWGVCEVPGWGVMLSADRVLSEMRAVGLSATELGAPGFLPRDPHELRRVLDGHALSFVGGFVPLVLHDPEARASTMKQARETAALFAAAGGSMFVSAVVVDAVWSPPFELSAAHWDHLIGMLVDIDEVCASHGLAHALHPHVGTLVETASDVSTLLERSEVRWTLDTGHLYIGGYDPVRFVSDAGARIVHVHLKDVRGAVATQLRSGRLTLQGATGAGLFCALGSGDAPVRDTVDALESSGYRGWYVIEQDTDLGSSPPAPGSGPIECARESVHYLRSITAAQPFG